MAFKHSNDSCQQRRSRYESAGRAGGQRTVDQAVVAASQARTTQLAAQQEAQQEQLARPLRAPFAGVIAEKLTAAGQWARAESAVFQLAQINPLLVEVRVPER